MAAYFKINATETRKSSVVDNMERSNKDETKKPNNGCNQVVIQNVNVSVPVRI